MSVIELLWQLLLKPMWATHPQIPRGPSAQIQVWPVSYLCYSLGASSSHSMACIAEFYTRHTTSIAATYFLYIPSSWLEKVSQVITRSHLILLAVKLIWQSCARSPSSNYTAWNMSKLVLAMQWLDRGWRGCWCRQFRKAYYLYPKSVTWHKLARQVQVCK